MLPSLRSTRRSLRRRSSSSASGRPSPRRPQTRRADPSLPSPASTQIPVHKIQTPQHTRGSEPDPSAPRPPPQDPEPAAAAAGEGEDPELWGPGGLAQRVLSHLSVPSRSWPALLRISAADAPHHIGPVLEVLRAAPAAAGAGAGGRGNPSGGDPRAAAACGSAAAEAAAAAVEAHRAAEGGQQSSGGGGPPVAAAGASEPEAAPRPSADPLPSSAGAAGAAGPGPSVDDSSPGRSADRADIVLHQALSRAASADDAAACPPPPPHPQQQLHLQPPEPAEPGGAGATPGRAPGPTPVYPRAVLAIWEILRASVGGLAGDVDGRTLWRVPHHLPPPPPSTPLPRSPALAPRSAAPPTPPSRPSQVRRQGPHRPPPVRAPPPRPLGRGGQPRGCSGRRGAPHPRLRAAPRREPRGRVAAAAGGGGARPGPRGVVQAAAVRGAGRDGARREPLRAHRRARRPRHRQRARPLTGLALSE